MKIKCRTLFDISLTGVTGRFRTNALPFVDKAGRLVDNIDDWNYSRNQQRNFETLIQIISLRTQPMNISTPVKSGDYFEFTFTVETTDVFLDNSDELALLATDSSGVPMLVKLGEKSDLESILRPNTNIWFELIEK